MKPKNQQAACPSTAAAALSNACDNALERLELRQLLAASVSSLPFSLDFGSGVSGTVVDKNGRGTGFTRVQDNATHDAYQPDKIQLDTANGVLKITSVGTGRRRGTNAGLDNNQSNALETLFNGYSRGFTINARLVGPFTNFDDAFEQAGLYFGPDQDNFLKLAIGKNYNGQFLTFEDEFTNATGGVSSTRNGSNAQTNVGSFGSIQTLDIRLVGDAATGVVSAYYRVNSDSASFTKVAYDITIAANKRSQFFNAASRAGILVGNKNSVSGVTATFDSFNITAGTRITARPAVSGVQDIKINALGVTRGATIRANLTLPNDSGVDASTLTSSSVRLYRAGSGAGVGATLSLSSDGKSIILTPKSALDPNTTFTFEVSSSLKDQAGATFQPYVMSFTTGASADANDAPVITVDQPTLFFSDISSTASGGGGVSGTQKVRITNTGVAPLLLSSGAISFIGTNAGDFGLSQSVTLPASIEPGGYIDIPVAFAASAVGIRTAQLKIVSNDPNTPSKYVNLRGLGTAGEGGDFEPSLQRIFDLYQIPLTTGDTTPDTTDIPASPVTLGDGLDIQRLSKAGSGPVTIQLLANFANSSSPSTRFGWYSPGQITDRNQLFTVPTGSAQTVHPVINGVTSFDPNGDFAIYGEFPAFANRVVSSEKTFNTWETNTNQQQKVRFFPLKNADGSVVPNAYIFAFEEYTVAFDSNDIVGIIRNVQPAAAGAEIGIQNLDGVPFSDRLVFSRIRDTATYDADGHIPNTFHDTVTLRITNSGTANLVVNSIGLSNSDFSITSGGGAFTLAPGATRDVTVKFVYNQSGLGNTIRTGTLTINSNDADEPTKNVTLSGLWQSTSEASPDGISREPTAATIIQTFGYTTVLGNVNTHGDPIRAGEEVLSEWWNQVDPGKPVGVRQLAAFHNQKQYANSNIRWLTDPAATGTFIFKHLNSDGQTLLPQGEYGGPAYGTFNVGTGTKFAIGIDSDYSIDARNTYAANPTAFPAIDGGHAMRFYPAKDQNGKLIPDTYLLVFDYVGQSYSNYDYQDDVYLLTNVRPNVGPQTPSNIAAYAGAAGIAVTWNPNTEGNLAGYNIYRSTSANGTYTKLNSDVYTGNTYTDSGAAVGVRYYYKVMAVDVYGTESSVAATTNAIRTSDSTPPAPPAYPTATGGSGGVSLNWLDNSEGDLAGYNVYRAGTQNGTYVKLNTSLLSSSDYTDLSAPAGATSYYRITAVDTAGNESMAATLNAYRPANGGVPAAPSSLAATPNGTSSIKLVWTDNSTNETGFIIERQNLDGSYSQVGTASANATTFTDTGLQGGTTYTYRIRATNASGPSGYSNESSATTVNRAPIAPTNLAVVALSGNAVRLTWTDNSTNESAYKIERRTGNGSWTTIDTIDANLTLYTDASANASTAYSYRVTATNSAGSSPTSNIASLTTPSAAGYTSADIGNPAAGGSTSVVNAGRDYDITAGGTDIWGTSDQFRFVYRSVTGDFDYSARITDISMADIGSMAGLMVRESLNADSRHIFMRARAQNGGELRANYRDATGGTSTGVGLISAPLPNAWVRLQRVGNTFTAYGSTDGTTWTQVLQMTMNLSSTVYFGMAASARTTTTATTTAKIRDLTDRTTATAPTPASGLIGVADTATPKVTLYWNDNATNESGYRVERKLEGDSTYTVLNTLGSGASNYTDTTVAQGVGYVYRVVATNSAGDAENSPELAIAVHSGVPAAPSNLVAANGPTGVVLNWNDSSSNETYFQVERRAVGSETYTSVAVLSANVTTYTDATAAASTGYVYRVRALGTAGDSNYSNEFEIETPATLALTSVNIGTSATGGSTSVVGNNAGYDLNGGGNDVWANSDGLRFAYRQISGDFDMRVRVDSLDYVDAQAMAGLMVRASLDANARNVFVKVRADGSLRLTSRSSTGGTTVGAGGGTETFPNGWLRLVRAGNTFTGYASNDGVTWTVISSVTMSLPTTLYVGLAVSSHVSGTNTTARFRDLTIA